MDAERDLSELLSEFARTLLTDFPGQSVLDHLVVRIVEVLPVSAAGVTLRAQRTADAYMAASNMAALRMEQLQCDLDEGPSKFAFARGEALSIPDLAADSRMPTFSPRALEAGFAAAFSFPLCDGDTPIGALDLYRDSAGDLTPREMEMAQTLADVGAAYVISATARGDLVTAAAAAQKSNVRNAQGEQALRASVLDNRQAGRALDASEARNTAILASALDAVITMDDQGRVIEFNAAAERTFGYPLEAARGRDLADLIIPPAQRTAHRKGLHRYLDRGESVLLGSRVEIEAMRADGSLFPAELSVHEVPGHGRRMFTGFVRDLTDRAKAERARVDLEGQLHQTQRLESLGQLAGGVAHDFNNLLTIILGYASAIAEDLEPNDEIKAHLVQIVDAGERAARLTNQLLTFARRQPIKYEAVDLNVAVAEIRELLGQTLGGNVHLVLVPGVGLPLVHGDRGQIDQVLLNLAVNARNAMTDGGTLTIETSLVELDGTPGRSHPSAAPGEYVQLVVRDSGEGMGPNVVAHAFDPFFTTRAPGKGSGLGLATVHGIVTETGGGVSLHSEVGIGTTVTAIFPVDRSAVADGAVPAQHPPEGGANGEGSTVLVVEDDAAVLDVTGVMLRRHGYVVFEAATGADAMQICSKEHIDLLLTDVVMPGVSGPELADALQLVDKTLPVLFMSGDIGGSHGSGSLLNPGRALLQKPFDEPTLIAAVAEVLTGSGTDHIFSRLREAPLAGHVT